MEKYLSWIHGGDLHKVHSEDSKTKYYRAFFEEWEKPVVMFPPKISRVMHGGFVPSIFLLVQIKLNMWGHKHTTMGEEMGQLSVEVLHE